MSIVVAVKKGGKVVIAADTMHSTGSRREHPDNIVQRSKLRRVGRSVIGGVGWSVYHVSSDLSVMQFEKYLAVGSGDRYAYGALHALYGTRQPAEWLARKAADAAVHFDQSCGGELEVVSL